MHLESYTYHALRERSLPLSNVCLSSLFFLAFGISHTHTLSFLSTPLSLLLKDERKQTQQIEGSCQARLTLEKAILRGAGPVGKYPLDTNNLNIRNSHQPHVLSRWIR